MKFTPLKMLVIICLFISIRPTSFAQGQNTAYRIDTIYYGKNGKECPVAAFAEYMFIALSPQDSMCDKKFRTYYTSGGLYEEGNFVSIDRSDMHHTQRNGECIIYYKSGDVKESAYFRDGNLDGEYTTYYKTGLIESKSTWQFGKETGISYIFSEDGLQCTQKEYEDGVLKYPYYIVSDAKGYSTKYSFEDDSPILETPAYSEAQTMYQNDIEWIYYVKNGITIFASASSVKDYGRYAQITICIANNSMLSYDIDPRQIKAEYAPIKKQKIYNANVLSADEYMQIVKRRQNMDAALIGIASGLAASSAGYSWGTATADISYRDNYGDFDNSRITVNASSYNAAAAFQAGIIAGDRMSQYTASQLKERAIRNEGYLKRTTILPGDYVVGYVNISGNSSEFAAPNIKNCILSVNIPIGSVEYRFVWSFAN